MNAKDGAARTPIVEHSAAPRNRIAGAAEVKREAEKKEGDRILRSERYFGNVYRSFAVPAELDEPKCVATCEKGVLELKRVTKAAPTGQKLEVE